MTPAELLVAGARRHPDNELFASPGRSMSWREAEAAVAEIARTLRPDELVRSTGGHSPDDALRLLGAVRSGAPLLLEPPQAVAAPPAEMRASDGSLFLRTSGTTGRSKLVQQDWSQLLERVRRRPDLEGARWLLACPLASFSGLQVLLHVLANGGTLLLGATDVAGLARLAATGGATHLSASPTFFRLLLATVDPGLVARIPARQVTLGGEPADQPLLDELVTRFPAARRTQVFATTEHGVCFSVHDGRIGFPAAFLDDHTLPVRLRIGTDGTLEIGGRGDREGDAGAAASFRSTGDLVEHRGDRVLFLGRSEERINVGGRKVDPREVEELLLGHRGVACALVRGRPSSLVGELVDAEVVATADTEAESLIAALHDLARDRLPPFKRPRRITIVPSLETTATGKIARRPLR